VLRDIGKASLRIGESEEGWLVQRLRGKVDKPDEQSWIQCTAPQLAHSIEAWLSMPQEFRPLENLIYGTIRNSSMFVETEFLSLAQGLESLHRVTDSRLPTDTVTFKNRIESLVARVSPEGARTLLGDPQLFEQSLRKTRNFFTHPGIPKTTGVLSSAKEIFLFNQKLHAFLRLLMLLHVGFPEDAVFEPVRYQSKKWH